MISRLSIVVLCSYLAACSGLVSQPENTAWDPVQDESQPATSQGINRNLDHLSPAIASLLHKADQAIEEQQWQSAVALLERALRINGKQAEVWTRLSMVHLGQYNPQQSIHMAKRSNSYARDNNSLKAYNWLLISRAYNLMQRPEQAAQAAAKSQQFEQAAD